MNKINFETDQINVFLLLIDCSGSMEDEYSAMISGLNEYKEKIIKFSKEEGISLAIAKSMFNQDYIEGNFLDPEDMDTSYFADGRTAMYDAIHRAKMQLDEYVSEVIHVNGVKPKVTFTLFTDGLSNNDKGKNYKKIALEDIATMNDLNFTTVFIAFGEAIKAKIGKELGFQSTIDVNNRNILKDFLVDELSKSTMEQSRSIHPLGSNFFSKATYGEESEKISNKAKEALEDRKWLGEIFFGK